MSEKNERNTFVILLGHITSEKYEIRAARVLYCGNLITVIIIIFIFAETLPHPVHKTVRGHQKLALIPRSIVISEKELS